MGDFRLQKALFLGVAWLFLTSCSPFNSKKPPIILILLESFSEQDYLCSDPRKTEDFFDLQEVCGDFIRFTHFYAPSTLSQTNVSSLFTGLPTSEHKVHHNGPVAISNRFQTLAESAINMKMRTAFFSGGVPIIKKFGASQGFEEFYEPFTSKEAKFFTPFSELTKLALKWIDEEVEQSSFFLTLYVPDLLYKNRVTQDEFDNERPISRASSVQEIHETINDFIAGLKKRRRWKNSHFFVLGVSGPQHSLRPYNPLSSLYLHVPLQAKLSKRIQSNMSELSSEVVSYPKLGRWLEKMVQHKPSQKDLIFSPDHGEKFIPQQNAWSRWHGLTNWKTMGLRRKQYLFSFNPELSVYDTFYDKKEYEPLSKEESRRLTEKYNVIKQIRDFFPNQCLPGFDSKDCTSLSSDRSGIRQLSLIARWSDGLWKTESPADKFEQRIAEALQAKDSIIVSWLAYQAMYKKNWVDLFELGRKTKRKSWSLVAQMNLREAVTESYRGCLQFFVRERKNVESFYQHCQDSGLRRVVEGLSMLKNKQRPSANFWAQVNEIKSQRLAKNLNIKMLFVNDIREPFDFAPSLSELYFFLPENSSYLNLINVDES